jgi:hypothetical protein
MRLPPFVGNMRFDPRNRGCSAADRTRFVGGSDRILLVVVWSTYAELDSSEMFRRVRGRRKVSWIYLKKTSLCGSRSIDATVRFCDDKVETNRPRVDRTDMRAVLVRIPSSS